MNGKINGRLLVIVILALALLGTGLTWLKYSRQAPSTTDARTLDSKTVEANFSAKDAKNLRPGMKAIITIVDFPEGKFLGLVDSASGAKVRVRLNNPPAGLKPKVPAQVTVDTSVPIAEPAK